MARAVLGSDGRKVQPAFYSPRQSNAVAAVRWLAAQELHLDQFCIILRSNSERERSKYIYIYIYIPMSYLVQDKRDNKSQAKCSGTE
eukprot:5576053-Amphidinium_carterae.1